MIKDHVTAFERKVTLACNISYAQFKQVKKLSGLSRYLINLSIRPTINEVIKKYFRFMRCRVKSAPSQPPSPLTRLGAGFTILRA